MNLPSRLSAFGRQAMPWRALCALAALLAFGPSAEGQNPLFLSGAPKALARDWQQALERFQGGDAAGAWDLLGARLEREPGFVDGWLLATDVLDALDRDSQALAALERAVSLAPDYKPQAWARLGELRAGVGKPLAAAEAWDAYAVTARGERRDVALDEAARLRRLAEAMAHPVPFDPVNLGDGVNSADAEYLPALRIDDSLLVFSRRLDGRNEDFFVSRRGPDGWLPAVNLGPPVNTPLNEGAQQLAPDGRTLYYTICHASDGFGSCDLYVSRLGPEGWSEPANLGPNVNTAGWESQPCPSADGSALYFTSNRPGGFGARDLWVTRRAPDGGWSVPENLGDSINTPGAEQAPFLHPDGATLYFTSDRHGSLGGSDLFLARLAPDGRWRRPENLGYPINTPANEGSLIVAADGRDAYYASDRADSRGGLDLYRFTLPEALRPTPVTYVEAVVTDAVSGAPLAAAVEVADLSDGATLYRDASDPRTGLFLVVLPSGRDYLLHVRRKGYLFHSENVSLPPGQPGEPRRLAVALVPLAEGGAIVLRNVFFPTGSAELDGRSRAELDRLAALLRERPGMRIRLEGHTDNVGDPADNQALSEARAAAVAAYLEASGIAGGRLEHVGYGETRPVADNASPEGRAANRRTAFTVLDAGRP